MADYASIILGKIGTPELTGKKELFFQYTHN